MRITIEKGFQDLVLEVMEQIRASDPKLAVNHIIGSWAAGQQCPNLGVQDVSPQPEPDSDDDFGLDYSAIEDFS